MGFSKLQIKLPMLSRPTLPPVPRVEVPVLHPGDYFRLCGGPTNVARAVIEQGWTEYRVELIALRFRHFVQRGSIPAEWAQILEVVTGVPVPLEVQKLPKGLHAPVAHPEQIEAREASS